VDGVMLASIQPCCAVTRSLGGKMSAELPIRKFRA